MKQTPFTQNHIDFGAKMVEFAGYNMPVQYSGLVDEHLAVRNAIGVFDVSHMGEFWAKGPKALEFMQRVTTNDVSVLADGQVQYTCIPNGNGGIVDDMLVYRFKADEYFMVPNAANIDKDFAYMSAIAKEMGLEIGKDFYNASDDYAQLAVQGPLALKAMQKLTTENVVDMKYYTFKVLEFAGISDVIFSITGYTGSGGCEIYCNKKDAQTIWKAVFEAGAEFGIKPAGLGARDTLRLEMGFCLYGHEIDDTISPIEAGLGWITKFVDNKPFIDREKMEQLKAEGVKRKLVGFELLDKGIPRQGYELCDADGNVIGHVCSGTQAPSLNKAIGTGYVPPAFSKVDTEIFVKVREKLLKAKVVKMPFK
ncbi:MAG: glycine cleavage system aminomethyltransferase GcvT [Bacteroidales bacterium]|jgi:aminomethyltransferase|nr:glycine cleavage system aminomethyltransferase GcvT [Bacteroidales bacterium]